LGQVLIQPYARLLTRAMGCARLIKRTYERFDVSIETSEPLDGIGKRPACGRVFVQELLSFVLHLLWPHTNRRIDTQADKYRRNGKHQHDRSQMSAQASQCSESVCTLLYRTSRANTSAPTAEKLDRPRRVMTRASQPLTASSTCKRGKICNAKGPSAIAPAGIVFKGSRNFLSWASWRLPTCIPSMSGPDRSQDFSRKRSSRPLALRRVSASRSRRRRASAPD
jgi:hypothetical protein